MNDGIYQCDAPYHVGHLDKRITLLTLGDTEDEYGLSHQGMSDAIGHKIWARIEPLRGYAYLEAHKEGVKEMAKITIRYRKNVTPKMYAKYRDFIYRIDDVIDPAQAHAKLELMCRIQEQGEMPPDTATGGPAESSGAEI